MKSISGALVVVFIGLKLAHMTNLSWLWLLVPTVGGFFLQWLLTFLYVMYILKFGTDLERAALKLKGYL